MPPPSARPGRVRLGGMRIGVVSDTHAQGDGWDSPPELLHALRDVDLILHCGDLDALGVLDHLETVAPVLAVRGYPDPHEEGHRLAEMLRVVEVEGIKIGMVHDPRWPLPFTFTHMLGFPPGPIQDHLRPRFGSEVDVVCFGDTHDEYIGWYQGVLFLNPGSPSRPGMRHAPDDVGTFAILDVHKGVVSAELHKLRRGQHLD